MSNPVLNQLASALIVAGVATQNPDAPGELSETPVLFDADAVTECANVLSSADKAHESALTEVARMVADILGTDPTFDAWEGVQAAFVADYAQVRGCTEETARKRWVAVADRMALEFALEKPKKPTATAQKKDAQRKGAAAEAAAIIEKAQAATPEAILALMSQEGVKPAVAQVIAKEAAKVATEASKAANEAARDEAKTLREYIRKGCASLTLEQLRDIAEAVRAMLPAPESAEEKADDAAVTEGATAEETTEA